MQTLTRALSTAAVYGAVFAAAPALAQLGPETALVSIYRVAPGKHLEFLKWMAARDAADRDVGVPATQWYAHISGDSWDYIAIAPDLDDATADKVEAAAGKRGLSIGSKAGLEFRQMMGWHSDTVVAGPMSASAMVENAIKP